MAFGQSRKISRALGHFDSGRSRRARFFAARGPPSGSERSRPSAAASGSAPSRNPDVVAMSTSPSHPRRMSQRNMLRDHAAHRDSDDERRVDAGVIEDGDHVVGHRAHRPDAAWLAAFSGPSIVEREDIPRSRRVRGEQLGHVEPEPRGEAEPLHEDDGRTRAVRAARARGAVNRVMDVGPPRERDGHGRRGFYRLRSSRDSLQARE